MLPRILIIRGPSRLVRKVHRIFSDSSGRARLGRVDGDPELEDRQSGQFG